MSNFNEHRGHSRIDKDIMKREQEIQFVKRFSSKCNEEDDLVYRPPKKNYKFYQICSFKNPNTQMYDVRIVLFNERSEIIKYSEYIYDKKNCNMLINSLQHNKFKIYPTNDIDLVDLPDADDLLRGQSSLLS